MRTVILEQGLNKVKFNFENLVDATNFISIAVTHIDSKGVAKLKHFEEESDTDEQ